MDIKFKNKKSILICFIVGTYLIAIASIACIDVLNNKHYLKKEAYINSEFFKKEVINYFENVKILIRLDKSDSNKKGQEDLESVKLKKVINNNKAFSYYIKNQNTGKVYTNISGLSNLNKYIEDKALYNLNLSKIEDNRFNFIRTEVEQDNLLGNIIVLKKGETSTQLYRDYDYYNSIKSKLIKEIIIGIISFGIGIFLTLYLLKHKRDELQFIEKTRERYNKIPIELRVILLLVFLKIMSEYQRRIYLFDMPIKIERFIKLSFVALYIFYLLICGLNFISNKNKGTKIFKNSIVYKMKEDIMESFKIKNIIRKVTLIYITTISIGFVFIIGMAMFKYNKLIFLLIMTYIGIYIYIVPRYIFKKTAMLNKIVKGTEEMVAGNLDYNIDENDKGILGKLAYNINNIKKGFKKSVESQVKSERLKSELITNVSHDLKTPLTSIINYVDLLKSEDLSKEDMNVYIQILDKKSKRLKVLIEDLFEASKISSGSIELNIEKVNISEILRQALGEFYEKIEGSSLNFKVNIEKDGIYANLDGKKTWRVFENLIGNILKYSMKNSRVYIDLETEENKAIVTMKNISAYEMDFDVGEIFERFKRADKARKSEGSGLGLAIAKSIVELQGGNMDIVIDGDLFKITIEFSLLDK
ncbi:sensor histidine kinase [Clostridium tetani]|uniref:sensor histidine kinase n=1 Tax=Clostridium tetani TaxID=1513 RepID=UPI00100BD3C6|nr:sensor histidine kinase [Clostridium tetani]RXM57319.1 sensor histidine kinase [Clostridium tetani]RXM77162.1 sensor histidine kinase [Clostridium tetani]RYU99406.1 sensor histidine kinase [Clostridium tetani]